MRTTLELDDELVTLAKRLAKEQGSTLGSVISNLARKALPGTSTAAVRNGIPVFDSIPGTPKVDMKLVNRLRDEE
jgi:hypothetical protein